MAVTVTIVFMSMLYVGCVYATCIFPESLQGVWSGGTDGQTSFQFNGDTLRNFRLNVPTMKSSDFICYQNQNDGDKQTYILKAKDTIEMFNSVFNLYFCLTVQDETYAIDTGFNTYLNDKITAVPLGTEPNLNDICNREGDISGMQKVSPRGFAGRAQSRDTNIERIVEEIKTLAERNKN